MTTCAATNDLNQHLAQIDAAQGLDDYREYLAKEFRAVLLSSLAIKINGSHYSFEDLVSSRSVKEMNQSIEHEMFIAKNVCHAALRMKASLDSQLDKYIEEMIDARIEEQTEEGEEA